MKSQSPWVLSFFGEEAEGIEVPGAACWLGDPWDM